MLKCLSRTQFRTVAMRDRVCLLISENALLTMTCTKLFFLLPIVAPAIFLAFRIDDVFGTPPEALANVPEIEWVQGVPCAVITSTSGLRL